MEQILLDFDLLVNNIVAIAENVICNTETEKKHHYNNINNLF